MTILLLLFCLLGTPVYASIVLDELGEVVTHVGVSDEYVIPTTGTVSVWAYPTWASTDGIGHTFVHDCNNVSTCVGAQFSVLKHTDNKLYLGWYDGTTDHRVIVDSGSFTLNQNAWNHFLVTWDDTANETHGYLNGTLIGSQTTTLVTYVTDNLRIGAGLGTFALDCDCRVAEVAFWSRVLSSAERSMMFNKFSALTILPSLSLYLPMIGYNNTSTWRVFPRFGPNKFNAPAATTRTTAPHPPIFYPR